MGADANILKIRIIEDFDEWLYRASYGHIDKYDHIINKISLIQVWNEVDNIDPIYEFLINN
jgi:hypothetical protein